MLGYLNGLVSGENLGRAFFEKENWNQNGIIISEAPARFPAPLNRNLITKEA